MPTIRLTRRYRFSSSHRLHSPVLTDEENRAVYGKCNNPFGHGHNYVLDVTIAGRLNEETGRLMPLDLLDGFVRGTIVDPLHLSNLSVQVEEFAQLVPTTENLAAVVLARLTDAWPRAFPGTGVSVEKVRIWETKNNIFQMAAPVLPSGTHAGSPDVAAVRI